MQNKQTIIIFGLLAAIILVGGVLIYQQNKLLTELQGKIEGAPSGAVAANPGLRSVTRGAEIGKDISENATIVSGSIKQISGDSIILTSEVIDLSKLSTFDYSHMGVNGKLPQVAKTFQISLNEKTKFNGTSLTQLKIGDNIVVSSSEKIYTTTKLTALSVTPVPKDEKMLLSGSSTTQRN